MKQFRAPTFPKDPEPEQFTAIMSDYVAKNARYFEELLKVTPANTVAMRRRIADATVERGAYPFA